MKNIVTTSSHDKKVSFLANIGLEDVLSYLPLAVYCCDPEGNITYFNQKAVELWGRTPNEGETIEKFCGSYKIYNLDGSFLPHHLCPMAKAVLEGLPSLQDHIIIERPDHSWIYARVSISVLKDNTGKTVGAMNAIQDVSAEKKLNQEYQNILENFRFLADFIPQLVWMAKPQGEPDYYNQNWLSYTGLSMDSLEAEGWFHVIHPDEQPIALLGWKQSVDALKDFTATLRLKRGDDQQYRWFLVRAVPMKNERGEVVRWFGTCTDVHDQKLAERVLKDNNQKLEEANQDLLRINSHLDTFIYAASHDLKAPISNIEGLATHLSDHISKETIDREKLFHGIQLIFSSVRKFKTTINNLTEITKIQKSLDGQVVVEAVEMQELVDEITEEIAELISRNEAVIRTDFENCPVVHFSRANLKSVLYNLVSNGIKYRSSDRAPVIEISTATSADEIRLKVKDNGLGLTEHNKEKMFTLFKRFHNHVDGSGMGLYIVKKIVDNAKGGIEVESVEGEGSVFTVIFKK